VPGLLRAFKGCGASEVSMSIDASRVCVDELRLSIDADCVLDLLASDVQLCD
jgi:hypothetical protein